MNKRLVIDSQLGAQDPVGMFGDDWSWPVAQSQYDAPIAEFFRWSDELHKEISDSPRLLNAFLLIKSDLLKDFSYYADAWLDIAGAKRAGFDVVFNPGQYILQSIVTGEYGGQIPTENLRKPPRAGLRGKLRTRLSRVKWTRVNKRVLSGTGHNAYSFGPNPLTQQIVPDGTKRLRLLAGDIDRRRETSPDTPGRVNELARQIAANLISTLSRHGDPPPAELMSHMNYIASHYLRNGWHDAGMAPLLRFPGSGSTLVTGTGGSYPARLVAYQTLVDGHKVIRTTHGGDPPLFDDVAWPSIELPFATHYVAHGAVGAESLGAAVKRRSESQVAHYTGSVVAAGSDLHARIRGAAKQPAGQPVRTVSVITASLTEMFRVTPHMKLHDVVYMEWHRRLLGAVGKLGYRVISKRHPKPFMANQEIFTGLADEELLLTPMSAIEDRTDAYVIDFPASAFMEAICTLKPVVVIDMAIRKMKPEARESISESVTIVRATFDERNRVVINNEELKSGLEKPVDLDARERLIQDYLLRPSADFASIFE